MRRGAGAILVIGLKYGQSASDDLESKRNCNDKAEEFLKAFRSRHGAILCREILGRDISLSGVREQAQRDNLFNTICVNKVREAVELLEELGY